MAPHPLADLTTNEIGQARDLVQAKHPRTLLSFKAITLEEPTKESMLEYLEAEHAGKSATCPNRIAYCAYYFRGTVSTGGRGPSTSSYAGSLTHNSKSF